MNKIKLYFALGKNAFYSPFKFFVQTIRFFTFEYVILRIFYENLVVMWSTDQLYSTKPELLASLNPAWGVSKICNGENLWQWSRLEIRLLSFLRSTMPQKQFIIIIIIISNFGLTDQYDVKTFF